MSLKDLTQGDFEYLKRRASGMRDVHEKEFVRAVDPMLIRAMYRGRIDKEQMLDDRYGNQYYNYYNEEDHCLALVKLFQASNTILPNLYFQNPSPIVIPKRNADTQSAALMSAALKHYKKLNRQKQQNQEAVLNAYFFGIGWKKMGYRSVWTEPAENMGEQGQADVQQNLLQKIATSTRSMLGMKPLPYDKSKPDDNESRQSPQLAEYETLFNDSENPMNVMTDDKNDLVNAKMRLYVYDRTLYDIQNSAAYDPSMVKEMTEMFKRKNGSRYDSREVEFKLNELHVWQRDGVWICSWVDEFSKALRYDKSGYQGIGFLDSPLVLTNEPGVRYPTSHMRVASFVQKKLDKLASMYVEQVARARRMLAVNVKNLQPGQEAALENNLIQGIIKFKGPIGSQDFANIASSPVTNDLPNLMGLLVQTITEITGADSQLVSGSSENKTLGQDELARVGTKIRESGMVDRVRDWEIDQLHKEGTLLKQYSNTELNFVITKSDYQDPNIIQTVEDEWVSFMTPDNPLGLKQYLQGEFDYDCAIEEAMKPDQEKQQAQYAKIIELGSNPVVKQALEDNGTILRVDQLFKNLIQNCDGIGNTDRFLETITSQQLAAMQVKRVLLQNGGQAPISSQPNQPTTTVKHEKQGPEGGKEAVTHTSSEAATL